MVWWNKGVFTIGELFPFLSGATFQDILLGRFENSKKLDYFIQLLLFRHGVYLLRPLSIY